MKDSKSAIVVVALGFWSVALTLGAMRVILPVYFASVGLSVSKIALLFVLLKAAEIFGPMAEGLVINRLGYRRSFIGALGLHSLITCLYIFKPTLAVVNLERFMRGLLPLPLMSSVYVKHFSLKETQRFHINMLKGIYDVARGIGMFLGGVLIAVLPLDYSITILGFFTAGATVVGLRYLPDLKEKIKTPILKIWGSVDRKIKCLGLARGLLNGASDAWGIVILPVYLTVVFGLSPAVVGTIMMTGLVLHGISATLISKYVRDDWEPEKRLIVCGLLLLPVCLAMAVPMPLYLFLVFVFLYQLFLAANVVYYNQLKLEFSTAEQTSIDLGAYKTISSSITPITIWVSGILADALGFSWPFYLSSVLVLLSVCVLVGVVKAAPQRAEVMSVGVEEPITIQE
ncbi:MAG: MFS transporter [Deltaproteobacteria bacterium]|nr:MFS transporter [Deltaproteobacteria bacterium]